MAYTLIGSDSFVADGGSNTNLQSHTPSGSNALSSNWTHLNWANSASAVVEAADNTVCQPYFVGSSTPNPYVIGPSAAAIQKAELTYGTANDGQSFLLLLAQNDTSNWKGYAAQYNAGLGQYQIHRVATGTLTLIANSGAVSVAVNDVLAFELDVSGNFILRKNGTSVLTVTDTTYTSGKPGIAVSRSRTSAGIKAFSAYQDGGAASFNPGWAYGATKTIGAVF